jgi:S1-C subfamily serine protease
VALVGPAGFGSVSVWNYGGDISRQAVGIWWVIAQITWAGRHPGFKRGAAYMGVQYVWLTRKKARETSTNMWGLSQRAGALVEEVGIGSPADEAGIRPGDSPASFDGKDYLLGGDTVVSVDGVRLIRDGQMASIVTRHEPGDVIPVRLWRDGRLMTVEVKLAAMP